MILIDTFLLSLLLNIYLYFNCACGTIDVSRLSEPGTALMTGFKNFAKVLNKRSPAGRDHDPSATAGRTITFRR